MAVLEKLQNELEPYIKKAQDSYELEQTGTTSTTPLLYAAYMYLCD